MYSVKSIKQHQATCTYVSTVSILHTRCKADVSLYCTLTQYMKKAGRKHPNRLADSYKCLGVNRVRGCLGATLDFFLLPAFFSDMFFI